MRAHLARAFVGPQGLEADIRHGPAIILGDGARLRAKWIAAARVLGDPGARGASYVAVRVPERAVAGGPTQPDLPPTTGSGPRQASSAPNATGSAVCNPPCC